MSSYFLGNRLLGQNRALSYWDDTQPDTTNSALFCPACGLIWGRIVLGESYPWHAVTRSCSKHRRNEADDHAGSFIAPWRTQFAELPPEVLAYELNLRLSYEEQRNELR